MKMKPSIALFAASALLAGVAGAQEKAAEAPAADQPKQEKEITVSPEQMKKDLGYFLGFQSGQQLGSIPTLTFDDLDQESFLQGIKDGMVRKPAKDQEQLKPALDAFQKQIDERISAKAKANLEASKKFMEENGKKEGVTTTKSGLQYKVVNKGGEEKFDEKKFKNPMFKVKYKGTLLDGTVFDDTKGKSVELPLQVIPGFAEALTLAEQQLGSRGRILVRASGTEPVIRVMTEGENHEEIQTIALELCDVIRRADRA